MNVAAKKLAKKETLMFGRKCYGSILGVNMTESLSKCKLDLLLEWLLRLCCDRFLNALNHLKICHDFCKGNVTTVVQCAALSLILSL